MLKFIITNSLLAFIAVTGMMAQTLSIGPTAGVNLTKISDIPNAKNLTGLSVGIFANYSINENFGLGVKALFSQFGTAYDNSTGTIRLNYIQIPLTAVYYFGNTGNKIRPKIYLGPNLGFLISAKDADGNDIVNSNGTDVFKKSDIGLLAGLGLNISIADRSWFNIDLGYTTSLANITDVASQSYKNNGLQLGLGVSFPVGN